MGDGPPSTVGRLYPFESQLRDHYPATGKEGFSLRQAGRARAEPASCSHENAGASPLHQRPFHARERNFGGLVHPLRTTTPKFAKGAAIAAAAMIETEERNVLPSLVRRRLQRALLGRPRS